MAESYVQIPPDSTGKKLRSVTHLVGTDEVHTHTTVPVDATTGDPLDLATEAKLEAVRVLVASLATENKLEAVRAILAGTLIIDGQVAVTNHPTGLATEATLGDIETVLGDIKRGVTDYRKLTEWSNGLPIYIGLNAQGAPKTATTWVIRRITWNASGEPEDDQVLTGAWTNRAALAWTVD